VPNRRLRCNYAGCRSTFPRKYELNRHTNAVHNHKFQILCPVYGCKRASNPFPRPDKFREHLRSHDNPTHLICFIETCHLAPLTHDELKTHLETKHLPIEFDSQPNLDEFMKYFSFTGEKNFKPPENYGGYEKWAWVEVSKLRIEGKDKCPVQSTECSFRLSLEQPNMWVHVQTHDLVDRFQLDPIKVLGYKSYNCYSYYVNGPAKCPICRQETTTTSSNNITCLTSHLTKHHTEAERVLFQKELSTLLSVFLSPTDSPMLPLQNRDFLQGNSTLAALVKEFQAASLCPDPLNLGYHIFTKGKFQW